MQVAEKYRCTARGSGATVSPIVQFGEGDEMKRIVLVLAVVVLAATAVPGTLEASDAGAEKAGGKKPRPCTNKNVKLREFVLCKPRAGVWTGTVVQQSGADRRELPLSFSVVRKGARKTGTRVEKPEFDGIWYCGDQPRVGLSLPYLGATPDKESGRFIDFGTTINVGSELSREVTFQGDFISRTRATGSFEGTNNTIPSCPLTLGTVTWTATAPG
jgi:hypothetical protein